MKYTINKIIGTTEQEIKEKEFNIFIPISLGNKWFTKENIRDYIVWALENTKDDVLVLVADGLHAINIEVRNKYSPEKAMSRALRIGDEKINAIKKVVNSLPKKEQRYHTRVIRWKDVNTTTHYKTIRDIIYEEYEKNPDFKKVIFNITKKNINKPGGRTFYPEEIEKLSKYVLDELPFLLKGIKYLTTTYNLHLYPYDTLLNNFADKIQKGNLFQEFYEKIGKPKFCVVNLGFK